MRTILLFLLLSANVLQAYAQDIGEIEVKLAQAVAAWQQGAGLLDTKMVELTAMQKDYEEMVRAKDWLQSNLEGRRAANAPKKEIRNATKDLKRGIKKLKKITKQYATLQKEVNELTDDVQRRYEDMNKLTFQKDAMSKGKPIESKVYSGYFLEYESFYHAKARDNVLFYPPKFKCINAFDGQDPKYQKHRIDQQEKLLFTYQPKRLPLLDGQPYIRCASYFSLVEGGQYFLNLSFYIHSHKYKQAFGYLERGSRVFITLLNGTELIIRNNRLHMGDYNTTTGVVHYNGQYSIDSFVQNNIKKYGVDKIRVEWSKGYEDYDVYRVDLLMKQFKCL